MLVGCRVCVPGKLGMWLSDSSLSSLGQFLMGCDSASISTEFSVGIIY